MTEPSGQFNRRKGVAGALIALLVTAGAAGCGTSGEEAEEPQSTEATSTVVSTTAPPTTTTEAPTTTAPASTTAVPVTTAAPTTAPPTTAAPAGYTMPNLVGQTLQDAQDAVQAAAGNPVFFSYSHDLSGSDRSQIMDSNWQVCTQNVSPGSTFFDDTRIDFGVMKLTESCP